MFDEADRPDEPEERPRRWGGWYILDERRQPKPVEDIKEWADWFETADRRVMSTRIGCLVLSTIFLGLDHSFGDGPPILFESMIFFHDPRRRGRRPSLRWPPSTWRKSKNMGRSSFDFQRRYSTWNEALAGHLLTMQHVQRAAAHKTPFSRLNDPFQEWTHEHQ